MSSSQANRLLNEQEEAISELRHKLLEMTNARDLALGKALETVAALRRIECCADLGNDYDEIARIARTAIEDYSGK